MSLYATLHTHHAFTITVQFLPLFLLDVGLYWALEDVQPTLSQRKTLVFYKVAILGEWNILIFEKTHEHNLQWSMSSSYENVHMRLCWYSLSLHKLYTKCLQY